jgi:hypothetical protein
MWFVKFYLSFSIWSIVIQVKDQIGFTLAHRGFTVSFMSTKIAISMQRLIEKSLGCGEDFMDALCKHVKYTQTIECSSLG